MKKQFLYLIGQYVFTTLLMRSALYENKPKINLKTFGVSLIYLLFFFIISMCFQLEDSIMIAQFIYILLFPMKYKIYKGSIREVAFVYYSSLIANLSIITIYILCEDFIILNEVNKGNVIIYKLCFSLISILVLLFNLFHVAKVYRPNIKTLRTKIGYLISFAPFSYVISLTLLFRFIIFHNCFYGVIIYSIFCLSTLIFYPVIYFFTENMKSLEQAIFIAERDDITSAYSRRKFEEDISGLIKKDIEFGIFYLDINDFKSINDNNGHIFGDKCLKHFIDILKEYINKDGQIYRIGGDEFSIITTKYEKISDIIEIICRNKIYLKNDINKKINISFSIGKAIYPINGTEVTEILTFADNEMYRNKCLKRHI
ncbi:GGDEF domain-containing protein [Clostridium senegalense]|uniref:GGDEF domain-containing protein n=1 Tax=Clostridium senegalense TaxID=1465809 RepID=UPI001C0F6EA5|nr:GGDEF domain-containing protein [Clostridium senegalense]MBU5225938.1 GGDEF domain-containing protein [Clostridium senegalense]